MAGNTIMTAKNSFSEGLVMDFAPDNTQANCLTSALNATLLTFNGNEMSLQNDMGNGRVETAYLPDGYVPVGTCEFGDIIYIVSYNPLIDKAQIGCFPSPERNLSSEETHNKINVSLLASDFQELDNNNPTGKLKTTSVKKILFNNSLHSGDQYIIYSNNLEGDYISDYGNTDHLKGKFPKLVKISIVSIEDSGKITYIDTDVKWYNNDYYIQQSTNNEEILKPDIDSYRSLVSSAYNTFASKVSGKLALLVELEKITGFDCTWEYYSAPKKLLCWAKIEETNLQDIANTHYPWYKSINNKLCFTETSEKESSCQPISDKNWRYDRGITYVNNKISKVWENTVEIEITEERYYYQNKFNISTNPLERIQFKDSSNVFLTIAQSENSYGIYINSGQTISIQGTEYNIYIPCYNNREAIGYHNSEGLSNLVEEASGTQTAEQYQKYCLNTFLGNTQNTDDYGNNLILIGKEGSPIYNNQEKISLKVFGSVFFEQPIMQLDSNEYFVRLSKFDVIQSEYEKDNIIYKPYNIYLNFNWTTNHPDVNPSCVLLTKSEWNNNGEKLPNPTQEEILISRCYQPENKISYKSYLQHSCVNQQKKYSTTKVTRAYDRLGNIIEGSYKINGEYDANGDRYKINDDIINNIIKLPICKNFYTFNLPKKEIKDGNIENIVQDLVYNYEFTPAMPYGKLDNLSISGYIDFNKIGTDSLLLNTWKYYVDNDVLTLTFGLEAYTEPNKKITEITLEFYDNKGLVTAYHLKNKNSYNGQFTNYFTLDNTDDNLTNKNHEDKTIYRPIIVESNVDYKNENYYILVNDTYEKIVEDPEIGDTIYEISSGILNKNSLYLVKIYASHQYVGLNNDVVGDPTYTELENRWLWTNGIFNQYFNTNKDFSELTPELTLDVNGSYSSIPDKWNWYSYKYQAPLGLYPVGDIKGLSANIQHINQIEDQNNVQLKITHNLKEDYNLTLKEANLEIDVALADHDLQNYPEQPKIKFANNDLFIMEQIYPTIDEQLTGKLNFDILGKQFNNLFNKNSGLDNSEIYSNYWESYKDTANLELILQDWKEEEYNTNLINLNGLYVLNKTSNLMILSETDDRADLVTDSNIDILNKPVELPNKWIYYYTKKEESSATYRMPTAPLTQDIIIQESETNKWTYSNTAPDDAILKFKCGEYKLQDNTIRYRGVSLVKALGETIQEYCLIELSDFNIDLNIPPKESDNWTTDLENIQTNLVNPYVIWTRYIVPKATLSGIDYIYSTETLEPTVYEYSESAYFDILHKNILELEPGSYEISSDNTFNLTISDENDVLIIEASGNNNYKFILSDKTKLYILVNMEQPYIIRKKIERESIKENVQYLDVNGILHDTTTTVKNTYTLSQIKDGIPLKFSAAKFSKYYITTAMKTVENLPIIKPVLTDKNSLDQYNLALVSYNNNYIPYFKNMIAIGLTNPSGEGSKLHVSYIDLLNDGQLTVNNQPDSYKRDQEKVKTCNYQIDGDNDRSYKLITTKLEEKPIFVPITLGYNNDEDKNARYKSITRGINMTIWHYYDITADSRIVDLKGSIGLLKGSDIYIADDWIDDNVTNYSNKVFALLRHMFKYENKGASANIINIDNQEYLEDNYSLYTRNLIVTIKEKGKTTFNLGNLDYRQYLENLHTNANLDFQENQPNISIKVLGTSKNIPFQARLNYEIPKIINTETNVSDILVEPSKLIPNLPETVQQSLEPNKLYMYNPKSQTFEDPNRIKYVYLYDDVIEQPNFENIKYNSTKMTALDVSKISKCFALYDDKVVCDKSPSIYDRDTYELTFTTDDGKYTMGINEFNKNLKFFKE